MARKRGMQFIPYDYEAAYNKAMEDMHEWFIENLFQHRKKVIYALKGSYCGLFVEKMTTFESDEDAAGQQEDAEDGGTASNDAETTNPPTEPETGENGANTEPQEAEDEPEDKVIIPQGKMKVTVICDGSLNIRRSTAWGNENICGRAIRGQSYYVKEIHVVDGKKMVRTIGDLYLSGESEHVQFEQL